LERVQAHHVEPAPIAEEHVEPERGEGGEACEEGAYIDGHLRGDRRASPGVSSQTPTSTAISATAWTSPRSTAAGRRSRRTTGRATAKGDPASTSALGMVALGSFSTVFDVL